MADIKGILFDKDGTLFDFRATWGAWALGFLQESSGGDALRESRLADAIGFNPVTGEFHPESPIIAMTSGEIAEMILPLFDGLSREELLERMNASASKTMQVEATPLVPFFGGLRARGLKLGIATNDSEDPARAHLSRAGIAQMFDFIAGYDSGFGGKPETGQMLGFAKAVALAPEAIVMVGDSLHDIHAGRAANMVTVGVLTGLASRADLAPYADVVLEDISHLPAWLDAR